MAALPLTWPPCSCQRCHPGPCQGLLPPHGSQPGYPGQNRCLCWGKRENSRGNASQSRLGAELLGSSSVEKDLGVLVDVHAGVHEQQSVLGDKARASRGALGRARLAGQGEDPDPLLSPVSSSGVGSWAFWTWRRLRGDLICVCLHPKRGVGGWTRLCPVGPRNRTRQRAETRTQNISST